MEESKGISGFNPSQVGYRLQSARRTSENPYLFQSLIGRLQTIFPVQRQRTLLAVSIPHRQATDIQYPPPLEIRQQCFNPSQVGYRRHLYLPDFPFQASFNPSQVGYRPKFLASLCCPNVCFNPSQVGYRLLITKNPSPVEIQFQSLIGRLQTREGSCSSQSPFPGFNPSQVGYRRERF